MYLFLLVPKAESQCWSLIERNRKQEWMWWLFYKDEWQIHCFFSHPIFFHFLYLSHTNTNQRTSAITPEITSLIDISITLCHSCVLSCLTHTPPVPILKCSMDAQRRNKVTLFFFFVFCGNSFQRPLPIRSLFVQHIVYCFFTNIFICVLNKFFEADR